MNSFGKILAWFGNFTMQIQNLKKGKKRLDQKIYSMCLLVKLCFFWSALPQKRSLVLDERESCRFCQNRGVLGTKEQRGLCG